MSIPPGRGGSLEIWRESPGGCQKPKLKKCMNSAKLEFSEVMVVMEGGGEIKPKTPSMGAPGIDIF